MPADLNVSQIEDALRGLGHYRVVAAQEAAGEGPADGIGGHHLLALGLRETDLQNINNPADSDHGCFQISENYHQPWLHSQPGCPERTWRAVEGHRADETGYCPRYTPALAYALQMLKANKSYVESKGVPRTDSLRVALNGYNRGIAGALQAWRDGQPDRGTTGGDYGSWCLRHAKLVRRWLEVHPKWQPQEN